MYKKPIHKKGSLKVNKVTQGETIEQKVERIVHNNEPIKDGVKMIYTDKKDGIISTYDIRTQRMDVALEQMDKLTEKFETKQADTFRKKAEMKVEKGGKSGDHEPTQGKSGTDTSN